MQFRILSEWLHPPSAPTLRSARNLRETSALRPVARAQSAPPKTGAGLAIFRVNPCPQTWAEVLPQRIDPKLFNRGVWIGGFGLSAPPQRAAQALPIGGPITGAPKTLDLHETLQLIDWVGVEFLPISADPLSDACQQMTRQVRHFDPGQPEITAVRLGHSSPWVRGQQTR